MGFHPETDLPDFTVFPAQEELFITLDIHNAWHIQADDGFVYGVRIIIVRSVVNYQQFGAAIGGFKQRNTCVFALHQRIGQVAGAPGSTGRSCCVPAISARWA